MKVRELIELLQALPQDYEVIISKDAEGNGFSPLFGYGEGMYTPDCAWAGDFNSTHNQQVDKIEGFIENAICLWPVN